MSELTKIAKENRDAYCIAAVLALYKLGGIAPADVEPNTEIVDELVEAGVVTREELFGERYLQLTEIGKVKAKMIEAILQATSVTRGRDLNAEVEALIGEWPDSLEEKGN